MKLFRCRWPIGEVTFVYARDKNDAVFKLDEFGEADPKWVTPVSSFMVNFSPKRVTAEEESEYDYDWELAEMCEGTSEETFPSAEQCYRQLEEARAEAERVEG